MHSITTSVKGSKVKLTLLMVLYRSDVGFPFRELLPWRFFLMGFSDVQWPHI